MSLGEDRVRIKFNPSDHTLVAEIKQRAAELIDLCAEQQKKETGRPVNAEEGRLWALAMTGFEDGAMWAVKAATIDSK